jgi:hypothetical protein
VLYVMLEYMIVLSYLRVCVCFMFFYVIMCLMDTNGRNCKKIEHLESHMDQIAKKKPKAFASLGPATRLELQQLPNTRPYHPHVPLPAIWSPPPRFGAKSTLRAVNRSDPLIYRSILTENRW